MIDGVPADIIYLESVLSLIHCLSSQALVIDDVEIINVWNNFTNNIALHHLIIVLKHWFINTAYDAFKQDNQFLTRFHPMQEDGVWLARHLLWEGTV